MPTHHLTICAKPVRETVGEHGMTATIETKPITGYLLIKHSVLRLRHRCTNEDSCILPS
jgi:hypothetical protein